MRLCIIFENTSFSEIYVNNWEECVYPQKTAKWFDAAQSNLVLCILIRSKKF